MAAFLWSTLTNGSTYAFNAASDILSFNDASISAGERGMFTWTGTDVVFSVSGKANAALNKTVHFTIAGGGRALTDANVTYANGSKLLVGDNTQSIGNGTSTFDDAANSLTGTAFNDRLLGLGGNDTLNGGSGNDVLILNNGSGLFGSDTVDGGAGLGDWIGVGNHASILHGATVNFTTHMVTSVDGSAAFSNIENAFGTPLADTFITFDASRVLTGLGNSSGNFDFARQMEGYAGNDSFQGDSRDGYFELVTYAGAPGAVVVNLATGVASDGYDSNATLPDIQSYTDTLVNIDGVQGSPFNDTLIGGGPGTTHNGLRFEQFEGMAGNDTLNANGATNVRAEYLSSPSGVTVNLATGTASDGWGGTDTLIGIAGVRGSNFNDTLIGNTNNNYLEGRNGNDYIDGGAGFDSIFFSAATSAVTIDLATGTSSLTGGQGTDTWVNVEGVRGGDFNDTLRGADGVDNSLEGLAGNDLLDGRTGNDQVRYDRSLNAVNVNLTTNLAQDGYDSNLALPDIQPYTDTLVSIERVRGSKFNDTLTGNALANGFEGWKGNDAINGGGGTDTAEYNNSPGAVAVNLATGTASDGWGGTDTLTSIENAVGSSFNDNLTGNTGANFLDGGAGDDFLNGGAGADSLNGGTGGDYADYRSSAVALTVNLGTPSLNTGDAAGDTYVSIERVRGSNFNDTLVGDAYNNVLRGGLGADILNGGAGHDYASYSDATAGVVVNLGTPASNTGEAIGDTYVSIESLRGGNFNDTLIGDTGDNFLQGGPGGDVLNGGAGNDYADYINAATGLTVNLGTPAGNTGEAAGDSYVSIERVRGSNFNDTLIGDAGNNTLRGGLGADILNGGAGFDFAAYSDSTTAVTANLGAPAGNTGEAAGDSYVSIEGLRGSDFNDNLTGNASDNLIQGGPGADVLNGGTGIDLADYFNASAAITVNLALPAGNTGEAVGDTYVSIEGIRGGAFNDNLIGNTANNVLRGGLGADVLNGGAGIDLADYVSAATGVTVSLLTPASNTGEAAGDTFIGIESLRGGAFNDLLTGDAGTNILEGGAGNDTLNGGLGSDNACYLTATTGVTVSLLLAGAQNTVGAGSDTLVSIENLTGSTFNDTLTGSTGNNVLEGGAGNDVLNGGGGTDTAFYASATAGVTVNLGVLAAQNTVGAGSDTLTSIENLTGSAFNDTLTGNGSANLLDGGQGNDSLNGGLGNDTLVGGAGNDTLIGGAGQDSFRFHIAPGASNIDVISDFSVADDTIQLENAVFTMLAAGTMTAGHLRSGAGVTTALEADDHLIYNTTDGSLYYDADANGAGLAQKFATLTGHPAITASDFFVT